MKKASKTNFYIMICFLIYQLIGLQSISAQRLDIKSDILQETRNINVHLPEDYENSDKHYSVIYMLDGDNDNVLTAEAAKKLNASGDMPRVIVVGISNIRRRYDFIDNAESFLAFIKTELIPTIEKKYRTNNHKVFMGHSLGGAFASYVLGHSFDLFDGYYIYSPAFGRSSDQLFANMRKSFKQNTKLPGYIYVSVGERENERFQNSYKSLTSFLKKEIPKQVKLYVEVTKGADHMENPELSIPNALKLTWKRAK